MKIVKKSIREGFKNMPAKDLKQVKEHVDNNYVGKVFVLKAINFMNRISGIVKVINADIGEDWGLDGLNQVPTVCVTVELLFKTGENWHPAINWKIMPLKEFTSAYTYATDEDRERLTEMIEALTKAKEALDNDSKK